MRLLFTILSIAYIAGIFLFADSSVVSTLAAFNPYSLLHIPLYGVLTVLLIFSFIPITQLPVNSLNRRNQINQRNLSRLSRSESVRGEMRSLFHWDQMNQRNQRNWKNFFLLPGGIASVVAIADEIHQAYVPGRDASITDVLLDLVGIILVLFFFFRLLKTKTSSCSL
jgi:hypothetical protein